MFYPAEYSAIFSCPLCEKSADALVCDDCYRDVLSWCDLRHDGRVTYWFKAGACSILSFNKALEVGFQWPNILIAHILHTYFFRHLKARLLGGEGAQGLVDALDFRRLEKNASVIQVDWFDQNAVFDRLNWVMFYE